MKDGALDGDQGGAGDPVRGEEESKVQEIMEQRQDHEDADDSDVFSRGWSKTGKRVMRNSKARVNFPGFALDGESNSVPEDEAGGQAGQQELMIPMKKIKKSESPVSNHGNVHSPWGMVEAGDQSKDDDVPDPGEEISVATVNSNDNLKESLNGHVCNICNRSFQSYQALGGHKAHHNNDKPDDVSFTEETKGSSSTRRPPPRVKTNQVHQCTLCSKIFTQGQALGGHKRHCKGQPTHEEGQEAENQQPRTVHDFDLNELPPEWIPDQ